MVSPAQIAAAAARITQAETTRIQTGLLSLADPEMTIDDAYAVQAAYISVRHAQGRKTIGWKIGLASKAMQSALNISTPDSGALLDDIRFEDGATIPANRFIQPRIEAELAFVLKTPLQGLETTVADMLDANASSRAKSFCPARSSGP